MTSDARHSVLNHSHGQRNKKHRDQWISTLERFIFPRIGKTRVNDLRPADFAACLKSTWLEKPETASRVKQRVMPS